MKWSELEIKRCIDFFNSGKTYLEISKIINRSVNSINKKLNRLGLKYSELHLDNPYNFNLNNCQQQTYAQRNIDWKAIEKDYYDNELSIRKIKSKYNLTPQAIKWAQENNKLKLRTQQEGKMLSIKNGCYLKSKQKGFKRYRQLCEFKFALKNYPNEFDFMLIKEYGWYKAHNNGNNPNGICRDHMISVYHGYKNNISPNIISHPANCKLILHTENIKKSIHCSLTIGELLDRIEKWELKYKTG